MANLITLSRFLLLFLLVAFAYEASAEWQLLNVPLLLLIILLDGVDGYVARRRNETSTFGSIFDIAVDRVVETVLWVVFGDLGLVPIWVALVFIIRGHIVDSIRNAAVSRGESDSAFGVMRSPLGRFLVAGRFMRAFYGAAKMVTFAWVLLLQPMPALAPAAWQAWAPTLQAITLTLIYLSVILCLARGVPVVAEFLGQQRVFQRDRVAGQPG